MGTMFWVFAGVALALIGAAVLVLIVATRALDRCEQAMDDDR